MNNFVFPKAFAIKLYDFVTDYLNGSYVDDDVLAISLRDGEYIVEADSLTKIVKNCTTETYRFKDLIRLGEDGLLEPDNDKLDEIASGWVFWE